MKQRTITILFLLLCTLGAQATDDKTWHLVTDTGAAVELSQVSFLLAASEETFDIVLTDGTSIAHVASVAMELREPTAVQGVRADGNGAAVLSQQAGHRLVVSGAQAGAEARVYTPSGAQLVSTTLADGHGTIDVSALPAGTYILTVGDTSMKFIKR